MAAAQLLAGLMMATWWSPQAGVWWEPIPAKPARPVFGSPEMPSIYRGAVVPALPNRRLLQPSPFGAMRRPQAPAGSSRIPQGGASYRPYHNPAALYSRTGRLRELLEEEPAAATEAKGPVQEVVAAGSAPVRDGDRQGARQLAIQQALRTALEKVVGVYVTSGTVAEKFLVLQDRVYVRSEGFVVPGEVLEETTNQGVLTVRLRASVTVRPLVNRLRELGLTRAWRIGVSIREGAGASMTGAAPLAQTAVVKRLLRAGFQVVEVPAESGEAKPEAAGGPAVDVLIAGTAKAELAARMPVTSGDRVLEYIPLYQCRVDARAVRVETGEVIASYTEDDLVSDRVDNLAAGTAAQLAADRIARRFLSAIVTLPASATRRVRVEVEGFANRAQAQALEEAIVLIPGVRGIRQQEFDSGVLAVEVEADVACAERLGTDLEQASAVRSFGITVTTDTKARIRARVKK